MNISKWSKIVNKFNKPKTWADIILGDPGAFSGGRKKSKRARKKFGRIKVKNEEKSSSPRS